MNERWMRRALAALALLAGVTVAWAGPGEQLRKPGWFLGIPISMHVQLPATQGGTAPARPVAGYSRLTVYVTAPTRPVQDATSAGMRVQAPMGVRMLPPHDDVVSRLVAQGQPAEVIGYFVVAGPKATAQNLHTQADIANSWPGAPLAREMLVGTAWVPLTSHVVIQYGIKIGVLALRYFDYGGLMWTELPVGAPAGFTAEAGVSHVAANRPDMVQPDMAPGGGVSRPAATTPSGATSPSGAPTGPKVVPGFYLGMQVLVHGNLAPRKGAPAAPEMAAYVTGVVDATGGFHDAEPVTLPGNRHRVLPPHQFTLRLMPTEASPQLAVGYFVLPGPKATADNVRAEARPAHSWPSGPLATAIHVGNTWLKLDSHVVIQYGLEAGLLRLEYFSSGGLMWAQFMDPEANGLRIAAESQPAPVIPPHPEIQ